MRTAIFFVFLFFHILCKGNGLHTASYHHIGNSTCSTRLAKSESFSVIDAELDTSIIEELDLDEAHFSGDHPQNVLVNKSDLLFDKWYLSFFSSPFPDKYRKYFKPFLLFCSNISPIYIRQRVLKI
jgi:hypothetical protein